MNLKDIDQGNEFDFGKTAKDYAKYRDIYPRTLYEKVFQAGIGLPGQRILDLGTGTGVFPRGMYRYGGKYTGVDVAVEQIAEAQRISRELGQDIRFLTCSAENIDFPKNAFDVVTAVQCFLYFNTEVVVPRVHKVLSDTGLFMTIWMAWIPGQSEIARKTEELVLKYNPKWQGYGYTPAESVVPEWSKPFFNLKTIENYIEDIPFTVDSWLGRIRACRGVAAALDPETVARFDREHRAMVERFGTGSIQIPHQVLIHVFEKKV